MAIPIWHYQQPTCFWNYGHELWNPAIIHSYQIILMMSMVQKIIHPDPDHPFFQRIFHEILTNQRAWGSADGNPHLDSNPTIATQPHRHRCQMVRSEDAWRGRVVRVPPRRRGAGSGAGMMGTDFTGKNGGTW